MKKEHIFKSGIELKECSSCKRWKELNCFSKNKSSHDGLKHYCKECASEKGKEYREKRKYHKKESNAKWYRKTKAQKEERTERELEKELKICWSCKEVLGISCYRERANGGFYSICKKCENIKNKEYRKTHREVYAICHAVSEQKRRNRDRKLTHDFSSSDWKKCVKYFDSSCAYCGDKSELTQDHFIPISKGGNYTKENIIPSCRKCNSSKNNSDFEIWFKKQSFYQEERELKIKTYLHEQANTEVIS